MSILSPERVHRTERDADALIPEARQHRRRRYLVIFTLMTLAVAGLLLSIGLGKQPSRPVRTFLPPVRDASVGASDDGPIQSLKWAGPLAVGPTGALYVVDEVRHEVLKRLSTGQFEDVAGDGSSGFTADGEPATKAKLSDVHDITFGPNGDLYIADGGRVRTVTPTGVIKTIVGDGRTQGNVASGTPALSASLGSVSSVAFSPSGTLYLDTLLTLGSRSQLLRLTKGGTLETVSVTIASGYNKGSLGKYGFGNLAFDSRGDLYTSGGPGWFAYKINANGVATLLGSFRRSGGSYAVLARSPNGNVDADNGTTIDSFNGDKTSPLYTFNKVPGTQWFSLTYFAIAPDGTIYADYEGPAFQPFQQIVSLTNDHRVTSLWRKKVTDIPG